MQDRAMTQARTRRELSMAVATEATKGFLCRPGTCTDFRGPTALECPGGHWIQREAPAEVDRALLRFLDGVP
jgi:hypothetical protein